MSNRTIIEINHDLAHEIDRNRFDFMNALGAVLRSSDNEEGWSELKRLGVRLVATGHHTDDLFEKCRAATGADQIYEDMKRNKG